MHQTTYIFVDPLQIIQKLEAFYRHPISGRWYVCLDPLNAYGAHAIMTKTLAPAYSNYIVYQQGYWNRNAGPKISPTFDVDMYNLVWHEDSHIYTNSLLKQYRSGFIYTDQLARFILDDYLTTSQYSSFDAYFPVLLKRWATVKL